jgi:NAD(P)-dependent dehydrogenase (short-subunit alcohol dehydrogenase family)
VTTLEGSVAIVTGASRGIGAATARALAAAGAAVALAARDATALAALAAELTAAGRRAIAVPTDVTHEPSVAALVERTLDSYGRLDVAVNAAATAGRRPTPLAELGADAFDSTIATSLRGPFVSMKHEIPAMLESGGGAIVNVASTAALEGVGGVAGYVASKHGVVGLTRSAALDYAARGVRVNAVAPGPILTEHLQQAGVAIQQRTAAAIPMRRLGRSDEVAAAILWLCSEQASFITGATLPVDGGLLAGMQPFGPPSEPST